MRDGGAPGARGVLGRFPPRDGVDSHRRGSSMRCRLMVSRWSRRMPITGVLTRGLSIWCDRCSSDHTAVQFMSCRPLVRRLSIICRQWHSGARSPDPFPSCAGEVFPLCLGEASRGPGSAGRHPGCSGATRGLRASMAPWSCPGFPVHRGIGYTLLNLRLARCLLRVGRRLGLVTLYRPVND